MKKRSALNKLLILILLCLTIACFGLASACKIPDENSEGGSGEEVMHAVIDDAYLCKSTGRLMASRTVGGDLLPVSFDLKEGESYSFNGQEGVTINKELIQSLDRDATHVIFISKADGKTVTYNAKVAERVIVRFGHNDRYADMGVYGPNASDDEDYLVRFDKASASGSQTGTSIFYFATKQSTSVCGMKWATSTFDGLYVLANDIKYMNEGTTKRNVSITDGYTNQPLTWNVDTTFESIDGKREPAYFIPRKGYGFIGTFDGRGKVINTNGRNTSIGLLPPAYGATIKNLAMTNVYTNTYNSESPLVCSARETTFENIYIEFAGVNSWQGDANKPMFTNLDTCTLKNVVVDCDLLDLNTPLKFGKENNTDQNSGYGQGRETTGVFSFVDFCDVSSTGTSVLSAHSYTNTPTSDAFVGTTAVNVYAVGSTPLYINQEMELRSGYAYRPTMRTTYFVNEMYKYKSGNSTLTCNQTSFYEESIFYGTEYEAKNNALIKIIEQAKRQRYGVEIFTKLSTTDKTFKFRYINKAGFFDAQDSYEMKAQVLKDINQGKEQFDSKYWDVAKDGTVSWKGIY